MGESAVLHWLIKSVPSPQHSLQQYETWRKDLISHHILRLAFAASEEKRKWFSMYETILFQARLKKESPEAVSDFMKRHGMSLRQVDPEERRQHERELRAVWDAFGGAERGARVGEDGAQKEEETFETTLFFKVPFLQVRPRVHMPPSHPSLYHLIFSRLVQVMELVRARRVFLRNGFAYVPRDRITAVLASKFTVFLNGCLAYVAKKALVDILQDSRYKPMLEHMTTTYTGPEYGEKRVGDRVGPEDIDVIAQTAMPLCMQNLHEGLRTNNHLMHDGRQQYGLYLKGVGLSLEDALVFWQKSFSKKFTPDEFIKKYAYNIRHSYGKEGNRKDYRPQACSQIINHTAPGKDQYHGCPYKHWNVEQLRVVRTAPGLYDVHPFAPRIPSLTRQPALSHRSSTRLQVLGKQKLSSDKVEDILNSVKTKDFQIACRKQFEARLPGADSGSVGNHPNAYTEAARAHLKMEQEAAKAARAAGAGASAAPPGTAVKAAPAFVAQTTPQ